ncbi:MAG: polysaccharide biosynthesis protein [Deltaproteobacteria bacterium]|nr:polysaccharide biosynthesis protein [Deltaproteobacteria bacterium]
MLRFDFSLQPAHAKEFITYLPLILIIRLGFYIKFGIYKDLWRYSSIRDLLKIFIAATLGSISFFLIVKFLAADIPYPRSIFILDWLLFIMISGGGRLCIRAFREYMQPASAGKRTLLIGAGDAGEMIVRDMKNHPRHAYEPVGFIDDSPYKKGLSIHSLPIFGSREVIGEVIKKCNIEEILITMPSAGSAAAKEIYKICRPYNIPIKTLPGLSEILNGSNISVAQIKPLSLENLLSREPIRSDIREISAFIEGRRVLVTGAGGSIGSELCRQIIKNSPSMLILLDRYENGLFAIDHELRPKHKDKITTLIGDVCDADAMDRLFSAHKPEIVFHAAAHKHVPLMEANPLEAIKNNIFGTKNVAQTAIRHAAASFVMISSDKAVNPANVMGATKRVAEFLTMNLNSQSPTKFTTVRFGNVLGSNGSVVHIFKEQLSRGGPLTITHPEIKRFFMLIPEAVQLVLIASAGSGGEIFVLDMGEQIKIVDLAENLIRLSGFIPHEEIKIEFTELRPGEKLFEELFDETEKTMPSFHKKLQVAVPCSVPTKDELSRHLSALSLIIQNNAIDEIIPEIRKIVPNFKKI